MGFSIWHIIVLLIVVVLLFGVGKGKIPSIMGDLGKGLRSFKDGLSGADEKKPEVLPPSDKKDS